MGTFWKGLKSNMRKQLRVLAELGQETKAVLLLSRYFLKHFCRVEDIEIGDVVEGPKLHKEMPKIKRQITIIYDSKSPYEDKEGFTPMNNYIHGIFSYGTVKKMD